MDLAPLAQGPCERPLHPRTQRRCSPRAPVRYSRAMFWRESPSRGRPRSPSRSARSSWSTSRSPSACSRPRQSEWRSPSSEPMAGAPSQAAPVRPQPRQIGQRRGPSPSQARHRQGRNRWRVRGACGAGRRVRRRGRPLARSRAAGRRLTQRFGGVALGRSGRLGSVRGGRRGRAVLGAAPGNGRGRGSVVGRLTAPTQGTSGTRVTRVALESDPRSSRAAKRSLGESFGTHPVPVSALSWIQRIENPVSAGLSQRARQDSNL
jgi:hypothetical protein